MSAGVSAFNRSHQSSVVWTGMEKAKGSSSQPCTPENGSPAISPKNLAKGKPPLLELPPSPSWNSDPRVLRHMGEVLTRFLQDKHRGPTHEEFLSMVNSKSFKVEPTTDPKKLIEVAWKAIINEDGPVTYHLPVPYVLAHDDALHKIQNIAEHFGRTVDTSNKASTMKIRISARPLVEEVPMNRRELKEIEDAREIEREVPAGCWY